MESGRRWASEAPALLHTDPLLARSRTEGPSVQDYKDANHKPEMAIAITDFEAVCSFVPMSELSEVRGCGPGPKTLQKCSPSAAKRSHGPCSRP